jgi:hypothetical protein
MVSAAAALDTGAFVLGRMAEPSRQRRERDAIVRIGRAAYRAAGGSSSAAGEWVWNAHRATWVQEDCVVKVTRSAYGADALRRDLAVRSCIHARPAWQAWRPMVARTLAEHRDADRLAVVEERLPGRPLTDTMHDDRVERVRRQVRDLLAATSHEVAADARTYAWFHGPAATVAGLLRRRGRRELAEAVTRWASDVAWSFEGTTCRVALVHGDLWPGNVLLRRDGGLGFIDWDQASFHDAALHDLLHLGLYPVCHERRVDLGLLIRTLLMGRDDDPVLRDAVRRSGVDDVLDDVGIDRRDALIWYWLRHVDRMIREPGHATNPRWVTNNVLAVGTAINQGKNNKK